MKTNMKIDEIREIGLDALRKSLGPDGMIRFLQQFYSGSGNYTKDRNKWLTSADINSIYDELKK
ncbi:MAG TPA: hypothetical protein PLT75_16970 [Spirochaetota bacterium]|nr:hypothetical protein [Spirochaetota bacterium]